MLTIQRMTVQQPPSPVITPKKVSTSISPNAHQEHPPPGSPHYFPVPNPEYPNHSHGGTSEPYSQHPVPLNTTYTPVNNPAYDPTSSLSVASFPTPTLYSAPTGHDPILQREFRMPISTPAGREGAWGMVEGGLMFDNGGGRPRGWWRRRVVVSYVTK